MLPASAIRSVAGTVHGWRLEAPGAPPTRVQAARKAAARSVAAARLRRRRAAQGRVMGLVDFGQLAVAERIGRDDARLTRVRGPVAAIDVEQAVLEVRIDPVDRVS